MSRRKVMFAMTAPGGVAQAALDKVLQIVQPLDAELELFHCVYEPGIASAGRAFSRGITQDIRQVVEHRRWQMENNARTASRFRWTNPWSAVRRRSRKPFRRSFISTTHADHGTQSRAAARNSSTSQRSSRLMPGPRTIRNWNVRCASWHHATTCLHII